MKKKLAAIIMCVTMSACLLAGCGSDSDVAATDDTAQSDEAETEETEETEETDEGLEACSDETFSNLQDAYAYLTEEYNMVEDFYLNNSDVPQDDDVESILASAKEYLDEAGEINQADITEADAEEIGESMVDVADSLSQVADALGATADAAASDACSDETFSTLQDAYANLTEEYNLVEDFYINNSDIPQDDDVESILGTAKEYLDEVGDINQTDITEADAEEIAQSMIDIATSLEELAKALAQ